MNLTLNHVFEHYPLKVTGVIHAGAYLGEEAPIYKKAGIQAVTWIEANPEIIPGLKARVCPLNHRVIQTLLADVTGSRRVFHVTNKPYSSSMLALALHKRYYPDIDVEKTIELETSTLDSLGLKGNFLTIDLQGAELIAFRGAAELLKQIDYIYSEVSTEEFYKAQALVTELDAHLSEFTRVVTGSGAHTNAFYMRTTILERQTFPDKLRPAPAYDPFPPHHTGPYLEDYFYEYYWKHRGLFNRQLIPIPWTSFYNNRGDVPKTLQNVLDSLDIKKKYFTLVQHSHGIQERLPPDTIVFNAGGGRPDPFHVPIPLLCSPHAPNWDSRGRDLLCSFMGAETHPCRRELAKYFAGQSGSSRLSDNCYISLFPRYTQFSRTHTDIFRSITQRSLFALCPRGTGPTSFRLYEVMNQGAVPVYIFDDPWLPYEDLLNWSMLCVSVHVSSLPKLREILEREKENLKIYRRVLRAAYNDFFTMDGMCRYIANYLEANE